MTVLPTAGDQLSAILNSIQSRPSLPAPSIFDQAAKPPSSLVHSPFVFGQSLSFQQPQPQLQSKSVSLSCLISPFLKHCHCYNNLSCLPAANQPSNNLLFLFCFVSFVAFHDFEANTCLPTIIQNWYTDLLCMFCSVEDV